MICLNCLKRSFSSQKGFSLLEISIALTIIAILGYGMSGSLRTVNDFDKYAENRIILKKNYDAFITFAQVNGFLPCPDTDGDGVENRATTTPFECEDKNGQVPFRDLGIAFGDAWEQPLHYSVNHEADNGTGQIIDPLESASFFSNQLGALKFNIDTPPFGSNGASGNYTVCNEFAGSSCDAGTSSAGIIGFSVIAVVISYGKNGGQAWAGNVTSAAEIENTDNDNYFWQAAGSNEASAEFDDQLFWITGYDVKYAALKSGRAIQ